LHSVLLAQPRLLNFLDLTGLVSTFLLIAGVAGANLSSTDILLTALSGTIAGAISMAAGE
jgi:VIT1/CCC1 family predicted Fe2+/Mn2+ transporter